MNNVLLFPLAALLLTSSCSSDPEPLALDKATVVGSSQGVCSCWPGYLLKVSDNTYLFRNVPQSSNLDLSKEVLPIDVYVKWVPLEDTCISICGIAVLSEPLATILFIKKIND
ncbi:MAG: hypothetical protein JKY52_15615 [Flavobacteriales bacterium]|nr:hypothetical protein [Flavobacteriales bacterium]